MQRLLITGVDQVVGSNLALALADRFDVFGLPSASPPWVRDAHGDSQHDIVQLTRAICESHPHWVIHCSELSANQWDLRQLRVAQQDVSEQDSLEMAAHLAELTRSIGARLTVVVGDSLFAGPGTFHDENSISRSISTIAQCVAQLERVFDNEQTLIVRSHAYGWSPSEDEATFAQTAVESLTSGVEVQASASSFASPILASDLADLLVDCYRREMTGTLHLSGAERASQYRFVCELAKAIGADASLIRCPIEATDRQAAETSLTTTRHEELRGIKLPLLREGAERFVAQWRACWNDRLAWQSSTFLLERAA